MDRGNTEAGEAKVTPSLAYFGGSIAVGLIYFSHLFDMLKHSGAEANNYAFVVFALLWVPLSVVALIGFRKRLLYCLSPAAYLIYFVVNWALSPDFQFKAEFTPLEIACVIFGAFYAVLNAAFLYVEFHRDRREQAKARP